MNSAISRKTAGATRGPAFLILAIVLAVPLLLAPQTARAAASFDCARAARPIEKLICGNADLSDLDGRMAQAFRQRLDQGGPAVRQDQRRWLAARLKICAIPAGGQDESPPSLRRKAVSCLIDLYHKRLTALMVSPSERDTPIRLVTGHPLKKDWMPLPRIAGAKGHPALERINRALAAADAKDAGNDCLTERDVDTTLAGRRYLSLVVSTVAKCAGAAEVDLGTEVLGFDLNTGAPVNWASLLAPSFHGSDAETRLYRDTLTRSDPADAKDCATFSFEALDVWPDAKGRGIAFQPAGSFPASMGQCLLSAVVPLAAMRKLGANPALLDDIAAGHRPSPPRANDAENKLQ